MDRVIGTCILIRLMHTMRAFPLYYSLQQVCPLGYKYLLKFCDPGNSRGLNCCLANRCMGFGRTARMYVRPYA